jgi:hypothetical protein
MALPTSINSKLVLTVDRVRPTTTAGTRTESTSEDLPAWIANRISILRDDTGNRLVSNTVVFMRADADVVKGDELVVDGEQRPIVQIIRARDKQGNVHHLEVFLG